MLVEEVIELATIKDVAKLAGVGIGTASRVINKSGYASEETVKKVEDAIQKLGYVPNETARAFVAQDSKLVALFLPSIHHAFFSELAFYIEDELDKRGYRLVLCNSTGKIDKEIRYINMLKQNKVSGIIGISYNRIEEEITSSMPLVFVDRHIGDIPYVSSDNYGGGKMAFRILRDSGCTKPAFIGTYSKTIVTEVEKRRSGFQDGAAESGIDPVIFIEQDPIKNQTAFLHQFLKKHPDVDGVLVENDMMAMELVQIAREKGINIPEELSVIGYDGLQTYATFTPRLSTIRQPVELMGRSLVDLVIKRMKGIQVTPAVHPVEYLNGETTKS